MSSGQKAPAGYQPTGQKQADISYQNLVQAQYPYAQQTLGNIIPQATAQAANLTNNPYYAQQQAGMNQTGALATGTIAPMDFAGMNAISGMAGQAPVLANQIYQTSFDPQSALYNRTLQQITDQANATNAMYGLQNSPYGAGLTNQALSNFNIDWQNNLLNRQMQGAQAYSGLLGDLTGGMQAASGLGGTGLQTMQGGYQLPYQTYGQNQLAGLGALQSLGALTTAAQAPSQALIGDLGNYLSLGQSATQNAQNAARINNAANASMLGGLGSLLGMGGGGGGLSMGGALDSLIGMGGAGGSSLFGGMGMGANIMGDLFPSMAVMAL